MSNISIYNWILGIYIWIMYQVAGTFSAVVRIYLRLSFLAYF